MMGWLLDCGEQTLGVKEVSCKITRMMHLHVCTLMYLPGARKVRLTNSRGGLLRNGSDGDLFLTMTRRSSNGL